MKTLIFLALAFATVFLTGCPTVVVPVPRHAVVHTGHHRSGYYAPGYSGRRYYGSGYRRGYNRGYYAPSRSYYGRPHRAVVY